jgi:hypothetical protein
MAKKPSKSKKSPPMPALDTACRCGATMVHAMGGLHCHSCKAFRNLPSGV